MKLNWTKKLIALFIFSTSISAQAGEIALGLNLGFVANDLDDMDSLIAASNTGSSGPINNKSLGNGLEISGVLGYRFDGSAWALHFAPSYYFNTSDGTSTTSGAAFEYKVTGIVAMPLLRIYALENEVLQLYFQGGVGWAQLYGEINEDTNQTEFSGSNLGYQAGVGLYFCYEKTHCFGGEANLRFLDVERNVVDKTTSSGTHAADSPLTQTNAGAELEVSNRDLELSLSGTQVTVGYVFKF